MTVNEASSRITYLADGSTTQWNFPFPGIDASFIDVVITNAFGTVTIPPANTFTVTLNPPIDPNPTSIGGFVTYPLTGPPLANGNEITIVRTLPIVQSTSISNQSIVYPPVIEQEFDYLTLLTQTGIDESSRAFKVGPQDPIPAVVPTVIQRKNTQAIFDADGNLTGGTPPLGTLISAVMIPVVTASTLPVARTAMGVPPVDSPVFTGDPKAPTPATSDNDTSIATTAFVQAAIAASVFTTGDLKPTHKTAADPGWILWIDGTIGDATSGASVRANADTLNLFTLYYNGYSETSCPLLTSTGTGTNRPAQGTAAAAFAAHCRMTIPKGSGRSVGLAGAGAGLTGRTIGSSVGAETHLIAYAEMPSHTHDWAGPGGPPLAQWPVEYQFQNQSFSGPYSISGATMNPAGGSQPMTIMQPTTFLNIMIKL